MAKSIKSDYVVYLDEKYIISEVKTSVSRYVVQLDNLRFNIASITCEQTGEEWTIRCRPTQRANLEKVEVTLPTVNDESMFHHRYYSVNGGVYDEFTYSGWGTIVGEKLHARNGRTFYNKAGHDITKKIEEHLGTNINTHVFTDEEKFQLEILHGDLMFLELPRKLVDDIIWKYNEINTVIKEYYNEKIKQDGRSLFV